MDKGREEGRERERRKDLKTSIPCYSPPVKTGGSQKYR